MKKLLKNIFNYIHEFQGRSDKNFPNFAYSMAYSSNDKSDYQNTETGLNFTGKADVFAFSDDEDEPVGPSKPRNSYDFKNYIRGDRGIDVEEKHAEKKILEERRRRKIQEEDSIADLRDSILLSDDIMAIVRKRKIRNVILTTAISSLCMLYILAIILIYSPSSRAADPERFFNDSMFISGYDGSLLFDRKIDIPTDNTLTYEDVSPEFWIAFDALNTLIARSPTSQCMGSGYSLKSQILCNNSVLGRLANVSVFANQDEVSRPILLGGFVSKLWLYSSNSNDTIFVDYINKASFGNGIYGIKNAAKHYFDLPPAKLNLVQSIWLVNIMADSSVAYIGRATVESINKFSIVEEIIHSEIVVGQDAVKLREAISNFMLLRTPYHHFFSGVDFLSKLPGSIDPITKSTMVMHSTLDKRLQDQALAIAKKAVSIDDRANALSVVVIKAGKVIASFTMVNGQDSDSHYFVNDYPISSPGSVAIPIALLIAESQGSTIPQGIINRFIEDVRVSQSDNTKDDFDTLIKSSIARNDISEFLRLNASLAKDLDNDVVLSELSRFNLAGSDASVPSILNGDYPVNFYDLVAAYSVFQGDGLYKVPTFFSGLHYRDRYFVNFSNRDAIVSKKNSKLMQEEIFNTSKGNANGKSINLKYISDNNVTIGFHDDYTVGVWAGTYANMQQKQSDKFKVLSILLMFNIFDDIINNPPTYMLNKSPALFNYTYYETLMEQPNKAQILLNGGNLDDVTVEEKDPQELIDQQEKEEASNESTEAEEPGFFKRLYNKFMPAEEQAEIVITSEDEMLVQDTDKATDIKEGASEAPDPEAATE